MRIPSLPDWAFYPLVILISAGLIYGSMQIRPPGGEPEFENDLLMVEGPALANFFNGPGTRATFIPDFPGGPVARLSADGSLDAMGNQSAGTGLYLPEDYATRAAGRPVRITLSVRGSDETLTDFRAGYFILGGAASGWQTLDSATDFQDVVFEYTPPVESAQGQHVIGLWADPDGRARSILVRRMTLEIQP